ncbi:hypothetical protein VOLCADRAFT_106583 [Volvox carteri f. nagariensis]|uniref:Cytochrome P450 n=1 Tax=Volvox carteri f. nagariensis TaxID=3068 RepID=D8U8C4_VOLCA|nr:uncharacterized protein VOLCADRAFT_106583 [Volvox carteri f. nagariensis]EFJ44068.1 hypothetical protein VOLCADRAFT_106583 [Volvox carteri f. nagariensis]|eukprot:XP_002954869.1 hypothetical protein VOLCADRAFT_106583 [Volvox carteri f. nagariensis]
MSYRAGPLGWPFVGNLPQIVAMDVTKYLSYTAKKYGPICKIWFGTRPWLLISDPVLARGETWRRGRRAFEASIIHPARLNAHLPAVRRCLARFIPSLERYASSGQPLNALSALGDLMLAITGELAYGVDFEVDFNLLETKAAFQPDKEQGRPQQSQHQAAYYRKQGPPSGGAGAGAGAGARMAYFCRDVFRTFRLQDASIYLPLQGSTPRTGPLVFPSMAPAIRLLADALPDANQRRSMGARSAMAVVSRQLIAQWARARADGGGSGGAGSGGGGEDDSARAVAVAPDCGRGGDFREVDGGISGSSFLAAMLEGRRRRGGGVGVAEQGQGQGQQQQQQQQQQQPNYVELTDDEVIAQSLTFILASYETSSTTTALALLLLAAHPGAQRRLAEEVDAVQGGELTAAVLAELPYTEAVLKETMRLYPALPMMHRHARNDIRLEDGRVAPKGTFLALCSYNMHHDADLWPQPELFLPERFLRPEVEPGGGGGGGNGGGGGDGGGGGGGDGGNPLGRAHPSPPWFGFGLGPRMCVGHKLATMVAKATLVSLLRRFSFSLAPHQHLPPAMATGLTYGPRDGAVWLQLHSRNTAPIVAV